MPRIPVYTPDAFVVELEARSEILERIPVIHPKGNDRAKYRRECVTRHAQPVSPGPIFPSLIDQGFPDVKYHRIDHHGRDSHPRSRKLYEDLV